ncbi:MAG: hypothetical protein QM756_34680 [Polyangiaceae bacterium]
MLFSLVGALLLYVAYQKTPNDEVPKFLPSVLQNVALIALTVVIVDALWSIVGGDPVAELQSALESLRRSTKLLDESHKTGLRRVVAVSGAWGGSDDWMDRLKRARSRVDVMGYTLLVLTKGHNFEKVIGDLVARGVKVRFLVMSPNNPHLSAFINHAQIPSLSVSGVKAELDAALAAFSALSTKLNSANFEIRKLEAGLVASQIFRVDGATTAIQYLYSVVASRSPILEVHGEGAELFWCYQTEFESLWELAKAV